MDRTPAHEPSVFRRELPGGGYVAIHVQRATEQSVAVKTRVSLERRAVQERRPGHDPVIIAEADGDERSPAFAEMYRIACDNTAIARALLRLGLTHPERAD